MKITQAELKRWLHYDPLTGIFTWIDCTSVAIDIGTIAGTNMLGYVRIKLLGKQYLAHVLAWLYMKGAWPSAKLDHIDRCRSNNKWGNLRLASNSLNGLNLDKPVSNTSGYLGVSWHKRRRVWIGQIRYKGTQYHLGCFATAEAAAAIVKEKRKQLILLEAEAIQCSTFAP